MRFWCKDTFKSKLRVERMRARTTPEATLSLCLVFVRLVRELEGAAAGGILLWGREGGKGGREGKGANQRAGFFYPSFYPPSFLHTYTGRCPGLLLWKVDFPREGGKFKNAPPFERTRKKDISLFLFWKGLFGFLFTRAKVWFESFFACCSALGQLREERPRLYMYV